MNVSLLIVFPLLTAIAILFCKGLKQVRIVAVTGAVVQFIAAVALLFIYWNAHTAGNSAQMLFEESHAWFAALNINYHVGVDGISVAMILLTAFVVLAGVLVSWNESTMSKEFFFLLILLSAGAYGFFISLDLFTLFFFLEVAVIPKFYSLVFGAVAKKNTAP